MSGCSTDEPFGQTIICIVRPIWSSNIREAGEGKEAKRRTKTRKKRKQSKMHREVKVFANG